MAAWIGRNLKSGLAPIVGNSEPLARTGPWPDAAYGSKGSRMRMDSSEWPAREPYAHLAGFLQFPLKPLSEKATRGFLSRLERSGLRFESQFGRDLKHHLKHAKKRRLGAGKSRDQSANGSDSRKRQSTRARATIRASSSRIALPSP